MRTSFGVSRITFEYNSQCSDPVVLSVLILCNFVEISSANILERSCYFNASLMVLADLTRSRFSLGVEIRLLILAITRKWSESPSAPRKVRTSKKYDACLASTAMWSIWFLVLESGEIQVALWIFGCGKYVLLITNPLFVDQSNNSLVP